MNGWVAILLVALATLGGGLLSLGAARFVPLHHRRNHHEVGAVVFLQLGVVFAVLLAFAFDETWTQYNVAGQAIDTEAGALIGAATVAAALPPSEARAVIGADLRYAEGVAGPEWRAMRAGGDTRTAVGDHLRDAMRSAATLEQTDPARTATLAEVLRLLAAAHAAREVRTFQVSSGIPAPLWVLLVVFGVVLELFVSLAGLSWPGTAFAFSSVFGAAIASILVIARLLDYPFEGALAIPPDAYVTLAGQLRALFAGLGGG